MEGKATEQYQLSVGTVEAVAYLAGTGVAGEQRYRSTMHHSLGHSPSPGRDLMRSQHRQVVGR
jgi:hypothetical protein